MYTLVTLLKRMLNKVIVFQATHTKHIGGSLYCIAKLGDSILINRSIAQQDPTMELYLRE